jgi:hypothetical protein
MCTCTSAVDPRSEAYGAYRQLSPFERMEMCLHTRYNGFTRDQAFIGILPHRL